MPGGSVDDHLEAGRPFSRFECKQILAQATDALAYLHTLKPQIVHRDVKPNNILILHRRPGDLFIKFADFGLSREGSDLKTICGTYRYLAPEMYDANAIPLERRPRYTALVDIWSLGVVLVELLVGLPKHKSMGVKWCERVRQRVESVPPRERDELLELVMNSMLCLQPEGRKPAAECRKEALRLLDSNNEEGSREVNGGHGLDSFESEASTARLREARRLESGDPSVENSSLSRYIVKGGVGACNTSSPPRVHVGELLSKLDDPEDSLYYRSNFDEDLNHENSSDRGGSSSASTTGLAYEPQNEDVEESPRSVFTAALDTDDLETRLRDNILAALRAMPETATATAVDADAAMRRVKRTRAAR